MDNKFKQILTGKVIFSGLMAILVIMGLMNEGFSFIFSSGMAGLGILVSISLSKLIGEKKNKNGEEDNEKEFKE